MNKTICAFLFLAVISSSYTQTLPSAGTIQSDANNALSSPQASATNISSVTSTSYYLHVTTVSKSELFISKLPSTPTTTSNPLQSYQLRHSPSTKPGPLHNAASRASPVRPPGHATRSDFLGHATYRRTSPIPRSWLWDCILVARDDPFELVMGLRCRFGRCSHERLWWSLCGSEQDGGIWYRVHCCRRVLDPVQTRTLTTKSQWQPPQSTSRKASSSARCSSHIWVDVSTSLYEYGSVAFLIKL